MRGMAISLLALTCCAVGCGTLKSSDTKPAAGESLPRHFYGRTIIYDVDPGAKEYMTKLENLLSRALKVDPPVPDDAVLPLYRDADINRDHRITPKEAETFYKDYVLRVEDALGPVKQ